MRSGGVVTVVALLALTACNGDDDTAASTTLAPPPTTNATTTTEVSPSTSAPTTDQTTTTTNTPETTTTNTPETTTTEATIPPTAPDTTLDPDDPVAQRIAVVDAVRAASQASLAVVRDPSDDAALAKLEEHFTGVLLEGWQNVVADYRANNRRQIENPTEPDSFEVNLASLAVSDTGTFATVQGCEITSGIIVEIGGNPDGTDRVIEDDIARTVLEFEVVVEDGVWKVSDAREPDESERIASCE